MKNISSIIVLFSICIPSLTGAVAHASTSAVQDTFLSMVKANGLSANKQSFCEYSSTGKIAGYDDTVKIIPASISKLYTFDFALATLGKDFRYTTDMYLVGNTLYINGGEDPHFVIENLRSVIKRVSSEQGVLISRFVFSPNFYFNWKKTSSDVTASMIASLKEDPGAPIDPNFSVTYSAAPYSVAAYAGANSGTGSGINASAHYQFQSAPLSILIKQINDYSTNISADVLFERAGGATGFAAYMKKTYGATATTVKFGTGSGLSDNVTTCGLTIKVIQHLEKAVKASGLAINDIMSVPRVDPGVLQKTLLSMATTSGVVAKSGYLDYHHNYAGIAYTTKGPIYFAVFGGFTRLQDGPKTELFVENFIGKMLGAYTQIPFSYTPHNNDDVPANTRIIKIS